MNECYIYECTFGLGVCVYNECLYAHMHRGILTALSTDYHFAIAGGGQHSATLVAPRPCDVAREGEGGRDHHEKEWNGKE